MKWTHIVILLGCLAVGPSIAGVVCLTGRTTSTVVTQTAPVITEPNLSDVMDCVVLVSAGSAEGSGCFVSADGIVMTARHVLDRADANGVTVTLRNGLTYKTTTIYMTPRTGDPNGPDLGFVKVDYYHPTRYLSIRPDRPALGDVMWCFGHPYGSTGCPWSVTRGIVSSTDRDCEGAYGVERMLQIDAAAYPGNSGGPAVDREGRVVGVLVGGLAGRDCLSVCVPGDAAARWVDVFSAMLRAQRGQP